MIHIWPCYSNDQPLSHGVGSVQPSCWWKTAKDHFTTDRISTDPRLALSEKFEPCKLRSEAERLLQTSCQLTEQFSWRNTGLDQSKRSTQSGVCHLQSQYPQILLGQDSTTKLTRNCRHLTITISDPVNSYSTTSSPVMLGLGTPTSRTTGSPIMTRSKTNTKIRPSKQLHF